MAKLFGTDGVRGEAGAFPLDQGTIFRIGRSFAARMKDRLGRNARFVTGRDTRESGEWIEKAFSSGAVSAGADCESAGVITTPGVAFITAKFEFDLGIVISASHNPFYDNGIKAFTPSGKKIDDQLEREIEADITESTDAGVAKGAELRDSNAAEFRKSYLDHLASGTERLRLDGYKIIVDCANGAASALAPRLFRDVGADVIAINDTPNGRNINENCGSLHLEQLRGKVIETGSDFGVAFDGDADRALFVDEKGNLVDGDATLWIMAKFMQDHSELKSGKVVATVMSNIGLEIALKSKNIDLVRAPVGDKYVLDELMKADIEIGGEQSGHIIFPQRSLVGDGMMTALRVLEAIQDKGVAFSEMTAGFQRYPQVLVNVKVGEKRPFDEVAAIRNASEEVEKILSGKGRLLLRYSGTENLARVMIEGRDQAEIEGLANGLADTIKAALN